MTLLYGLLLFVLFAGHCELMAAIINRIHGFALPRTLLKGTRLVHDLLVLGFLPVTVLAVGVSGPRLLRGGHWEEISSAWQGYSLLCLGGVVSLLFTMIRRAVQPEPQLQESRLINTAEELGTPPAGTGLGGRIALLPGNEVLRFEVNVKEVRLPQLPADLDGLSILHLSDLHFRKAVGQPYFAFAMTEAAELQADLVVFTGDLIDRDECVSWIRGTLGQLTAPLGCWYILGNHDKFQNSEAIRSALTQAGWQELAGCWKRITVQGRTLWLGGDETPWMGDHPDLSAAASADLAVLLSHTPDNWPTARRHEVDLTLAGHNHGGQVRLPLIGPVYSPSKYGVKYASGMFTANREAESRVLHVSRGLSSEQPLRWNCPPEITKLILRSAGGAV